MHTPPTLYTATQITKEIQISRRTLSDWMKQGRLPYIKTSARMIRFDLAAVRAALEKFTVKSV